jgi:hypothetical protein
VKIIIAGSRTIHDYDAVVQAMEDCEWIPTEIVSGGAFGVDALGEEWAQRHGVPVTRFNADWSKYKKAAGFLRNEEMADYSDALVAIWNGRSKGTQHMIDTMREQGKPVYYTIYND